MRDRPKHYEILEVKSIGHRTYLISWLDENDWLKKTEVNNVDTPEQAKTKLIDAFKLDKSVKPKCSKKVISFEYGN